MVFESRSKAGKKLASELIAFRKDNPIILALPRGGVPVGYEIAKVLQAPLDVLVVRKIGLSSNTEFGIGAIAEGGVKVLDQTTIKLLGIDEKEIETTLALEEEELKRRVEVYRDGKVLPSLRDRLVILVDDGIATGITAQAATLAVKKLNPKRVIFATPVCARGTAESLKHKIDQIICLVSPYEFSSVGLWYKNFSQLSDEEVVKLLKQTKV